MSYTSMYVSYAKNMLIPWGNSKEIAILIPWGNGKEIAGRIY